MERGTGPDWSLRYPVDFRARDGRSKVQVRKTHGELYDDVFEGTDLDRLGKSAFILSMNGNRVRTIQLPLGSYELEWIVESGRCRLTTWRSPAAARWKRVWRTSRAPATDPGRAATGRRRGDPAHSGRRRTE